MPNYRLSIDISNILNELIQHNINLYEYSKPFNLIFIEAQNPDDACYLALYRLMSLIMRNNCSVEHRILCRKARKYLRIDKVFAL